MKIIQALGWYFPHHLGGTEVYVDGLSTRLREAGHEVVVAAPLAGGTSEDRYEINGTKVFRFPTPCRPSRDEAQSRLSARGADLFVQFLRREEPDWVHFHSFSTGLSVTELEAAHRLGARTLATNHLGSLGFLCQRGTLMRWGERLCDGVCRPIKCAECELQHRGLAKPLAWATARLGAVTATARWPTSLGTALGMPELIRHNLRLQARILQTVEAFFVLNQWAANALIANGAPAAKIKVNRLGVNARGLLKKPPADVQPTRSPIRVGYFGRLTELKGVYELAQAFASLPKELAIEVEFRGPAKGDADELLLTRLKDLIGDDRRVRFAEPSSPAESFEVLAGYDVLCVPSKWFENGPTVMLEALAVGTPVLGTAIGAMPEVISHGVNGWLTTPGNVEELASALLMIASDPDATIDKWRRHLPPTRTMDEIASEYLEAYRS